jgi:hypothetical protein
MYPGRADMLCPTVIGRFGPEGDIAVLFSNLVGAGGGSRYLTR